MKTFIENIALASILVFLPIKATIVCVMFLTMVDLMSGVAASYKRKEKITSSGFKRTVVKILVYEITVMLGFLVERYMTSDSLPVVKVLAGLIGITELKSVLENIQSITGVPLIKLLIAKLNNIDK